MADYPDWTGLVDIIGSDVMVPIDVQAGYVMMPVDLQAQYITLEIDIVAQSIGNIAIDIAAQTIGNINVNINAQTANINVSIAASAVTLTVTVSGTADINIQTQAVGIYLQPDWNALQGTDKNLTGGGTVASGAETDVLAYVVTAGKSFYICDLTFTGYHFGVQGVATLRYSTPAVYLCYLGGVVGNSIVFSKPKKVAAGKTISVSIKNLDADAADFAVSIGGYEI